MKDECLVGLVAHTAHFLAQLPQGERDRLWADLRPSGDFHVVDIPGNRSWVPAYVGDVSAAKLELVSLSSSFRGPWSLRDTLPLAIRVLGPREGFPGARRAEASVDGKEFNLERSHSTFSLQAGTRHRFYVSNEGLGGELHFLVATPLRP